MTFFKLLEIKVNLRAQRILLDLHWFQIFVFSSFRCRSLWHYLLLLGTFPLISSLYRQANPNKRHNNNEIFALLATYQGAQGVWDLRLRKAAGLDNVHVLRTFTLLCKPLRKLTAIPGMCDKLFERQVLTEFQKNKLATKQKLHWSVDLTT